jgi:hypothetical protein
MSVKLITGTAASGEGVIDTNGCISTFESLPAWPAAGGHYTVSGQTSAVVAATLAADTMLMSARFSAGSSRKAYVTKIRVVIAVATVGTSALVAGTLGLRRFTAQTPTGGTARTANRHGEALGTATDMTDIRDSNAALTGTAPTWGNIMSVSLVPLFISGGAMWLEWIYEPLVPDILVPGDGVALRTIVVMPGTQTWMYSYTLHWYEK